MPLRWEDEIWPDEPDLPDSAPRRKDTMPAIDLLVVYVPTLTSPIRERIVPGSAIVSRGALNDGSVLVYYEGNIYNSQNMRKYSERVLHAAGRLATHYPTVAKMLVPRAHLIQVGTYWTVPPRLAIADYLTLEDWLTCGAS